MSREADYLHAIGWENADSLTGQDLFDAMVGVSLRHAERLQELGPVRVLALDPCPRCMGRVVASETEARCVTGCGWVYRPGGPEPLASRKSTT